MKKGILFIYSGKDKFQNAVACSTRQYIQERLKDYFVILLLNVDKCKVIKHLKDKKYDIIYIAEDFQELYDELLDEHKNKFDNIIKYNTLESRVIKSGYGGYHKSTFNKIAQDLEKVVRDNSKTITKYFYNGYQNVINSKKFKSYDFDKMNDWEARDYFNSEKECLMYFKTKFEKEVSQLEATLSRTREKLNKVLELENDIF